MTEPTIKIDCADGPFTASAKFYVTDEKQIAAATYNFTPGIVPSDEDFRQVVLKALDQVTAATKTAGWRILTRHELVNYLLTGGTEDYAVPGPDEYRLDFPTILN